MAFTGYAGSAKGTGLLKALFVLAVAVAFTGVCVLLPQLRSWIVAQPESFEIHLMYGNVAGLKAGAPVRLAGLAVGEVRSIEFAEDPTGKPFLLVSTVVQERARPYIREDSVFTISTQGLLGDSYVNVAFGTRAKALVQPGAHLRGRDPVRLEQTLERLDDAVADLKKGGVLVRKVFDAAMAVNKIADSALESLAKLKKYIPFRKKEGEQGAGEDEKKDDDGSGRK